LAVSGDDIATMLEDIVNISLCVALHGLL